MDKIHVQIQLSGKEKELYKLLKNKKSFMVAALFTFANDPTFRHIYFSDADKVLDILNNKNSNKQTQVKQNDIIQENKQDKEKIEDNNIKVKW